MSLFDKLAKLGKEVTDAVDKAVTSTQNQPINTAANQTAAPPVAPPPVKTTVTQNPSVAPSLANWNAILPQFPKWCFGGNSVEVIKGDNENGYPRYSLDIRGAGKTELEQYKQLLKQNGFISAGERPSERCLYKRINGIVFNFDAENAFEYGDNNLWLDFRVSEPPGGFDYKRR